MKRLFDVTVAGVSLLLCAPLWLPVSLYALTHPGEPLYGRRRMYGLDGAEFERIKFHVPAKGPLWLRIYRRLDLESVPSLLNVLRGEMSVVGPEPLPTEMRDSFLHHPLLDITLRVRPGLTGEWRTLRRREQTVNEKIRLDIYYLSHYRFLLDLEIFFLRTLPLLPSIAAGTAHHPKLREDRTEVPKRAPSGSQAGS